MEYQIRLSTGTSNTVRPEPVEGLFSSPAKKQRASTSSARTVR